MAQKNGHESGIFDGLGQGRLFTAGPAPEGYWNAGEDGVQTFQSEEAANPNGSILMEPDSGIVPYEKFVDVVKIDAKRFSQEALRRIVGSSKSK